MKVPVSNAVARDRARAAGRRAAGGRRGGGGTADWRRGAAGRRARLTNEVASHRHHPPRVVAPVRMIYERCGTHAATARRFIRTPAVHREARVYVLARVRTRARRRHPSARAESEPSALLCYLPSYSGFASSLSSFSRDVPPRTLRATFEVTAASPPHPHECSHLPPTKRTRIIM